jgi:hypothetical protein
VVHRLELHLLNFGQALPLTRLEMIDLLVQIADLELSL